VLAARRLLKTQGSINSNRQPADESLFEACKSESRALATLDRDFGQVLRYPPPPAPA
jgi:predicted nucleic acid-binding protein